MRFIIVHKTNAHWESGASSGPDLVAEVAAMMRDLRRADVLRAAEGLRASASGARITMSGGETEIAPGPFVGRNELTAAIDIIRAPTLDDAVAWAVEVGRVLGDGEMDVRPLTEPWDIGLGAKPADVTTRRFLVQRRSTPRTEAGTLLAPEQGQALHRLRERAPAGHLLSETMRPSRRGRRFKNTASGVVFTDGPFAESKELIGGFIVIDVASSDEACRWCTRYVSAVRTHEADLLELDAPA